MLRSAIVNTEVMPEVRRVGRLVREAHNQGSGGSGSYGGVIGGQHIARAGCPQSRRHSDADDNAMRYSPETRERQGAPLRDSGHTRTRFVLDGVAEPRWLTEDCTSRGVEAWISYLLDCPEEGSLGASLGEGVNRPPLPAHRR